MNTEEQIMGFNNNENNGTNFFKDPLKDGYFKKLLDFMQYVKSLVDDKKITEEYAEKIMEAAYKRGLEAISQTIAVNDPNFNVNDPVKIAK